LSFLQQLNAILFYKYKECDTIAVPLIFRSEYCRFTFSVLTPIGSNLSYTKLTPLFEQEKKTDVEIVALFSGIAHIYLIQK
jgi:hypothetical protein